MIRKLLATTAIATLIAGGAYAQTNTTADTSTAGSTAKPMSDAHLATNLIGSRVFNGAGDNAENVGEVNDLVVSKDGKVESIVVGVGGFLGLGQKDVAVPYQSVQWTERNGQRWIVIPSTKDELKAEAAFDRAAYAPAPAATTANNNSGAVIDTTGMAPADNTTMAKGTATTAATDTAQTSAIDRSTLKPVDVGTISANDFIGTAVYGANDARVGEIGDVALTKDGKVDAVVVDVGGFLGMGEKHVALALDNLQFMQDNSGNRYLYSSLSKEQLQAQPAYDKGSYASNRDAQRMTIAR